MPKDITLSYQEYEQMENKISSLENEIIKLKSTNPTLVISEVTKSMNEYFTSQNNKLVGSKLEDLMQQSWLGHSEYTSAKQAFLSLTGEIKEVKKQLEPYQHERLNYMYLDSLKHEADKVFRSIQELYNSFHKYNDSLPDKRKINLFGFNMIKSNIDIMVETINKIKR